VSHLLSQALPLTHDRQVEPVVRRRTHTGASHLARVHAS
jgi:hypothetical protein